MTRPDRDYVEAIRARFTKYRIRRCYSLHDCALCGAEITLDQEYYDGGYGRRAHVACVPGPWTEASA